METQDIIYLTIAVGSAVFAIFLYFRTPQEKGEIADSVFAEQLKQINKDISTIRDNHLVHLNDKFDKHIEKQIENEKVTSENFCKIFTILDERLPRK